MFFTSSDEEIGEEEEEEEINPFRYLLFLDEIKGTEEYKNAKERIELIEDIFSINEENFQKVIDKLRKYLNENNEMVTMFILVSLLFILTRFKSANQFGFSLIKFFKDNYINEIENIINIQESMPYNYECLLKAVDFENLIRNTSNDFSFYNYEQGTIPYYLFNDDIEGLQDYVSKQPYVDFNEQPTPQWVPTNLFFYFENLTIFDYSILFGSTKCFKYIMLQDDAEFTGRCSFLSVSSGNSEIIHILEQNDADFEFLSFIYSIMFHRNNIFEWVLRNFATNIYFFTDITEFSIIFFNEEIFYFLLTNGTPINVADFETYPIQNALQSFNFPLFKYIYETYETKLNLLTDFNQDNLFPLACKLNQIEIIKYFLTKKLIDIESMNEEQYRPIHFACENGLNPIVEYIISQNCDINAKTSDNKTPFELACINNHYSIAEYILQNTNFDINSQTISDGLFINSCAEDNLQLIKFLIKHGFDPLIPIFDGDYSLVFYFHHDIVEYVSSLYKDNLPVDSKGRTFLHYSAYYKLLEFVKYFISLGIDKDTKDKKGMTTLHFACFNGDISIVQYLISINADKDSIDKSGRSPIFYAAMEPHIDVYDYLISCGANTTIKDNNGMTPIDIFDLKSNNDFQYFQIINEMEFFSFKFLRLN